MWLIIVIFVGVFGFMFYACFAHRKSKGHARRAVPREHHGRDHLDGDPGHHPRVYRLAGDQVGDRAEGHLRRRPHIKATGYQWKWGYDYIKGEGEGISFVSTLATPREQIEGRAAEGRALPAGGRQRAGRAGRQEDAHHHHRRRRHPRLVGAGVRRQAGRDSRLPARHVVQRRQARRPSAASASSSAARSTASCRSSSGGVAARTTRSGSRAEAKKLPPQADDPSKKWDAKELVARGEKVYAANCVACHQPQGQGHAGASRRSRWSANSSSRRRRTRRSTRVLNGRPNTRCRPGKQLSDTEIAAVITYARERWGNKTGQTVQPAEVKARAQVASDTGVRRTP